MQIRAEIKAHSVDERGNELLTVSVTFPRIILAEVNTHRMLSKNTSSSRAIPFSKMVETIENNPFIPIAFQKHHSGMQGTEYLTGEEANEARVAWLNARRKAVNEAYYIYRNNGVTKQLANRLLEPFMWTTMLITGPVKGGWDNFFELRCPAYDVEVLGEENKIFKSVKEAIKYKNDSSKSDRFEDDYHHYLSNKELQQEWLQSNKGQGEIHIMDLAEKIYDALNESTPILKEGGYYHIPYFNDYTTPNGVLTNYGPTVEDLIKISSSMAARESYTTVGKENTTSFEKHIELYDKLISYDPPHSSPLEHVGKSMDDREYITYFRGELPNGENLELTYSGEHGWCRNFKGFVPLRHIIELKK